MARARAKDKHKEREREGSRIRGKEGGWEMEVILSRRKVRQIFANGGDGDAKNKKGEEGKKERVEKRSKLKKRKWK